MVQSIVRRSGRVGCVARRDDRLRRATRVRAGGHRQAGEYGSDSGAVGHTGCYPRIHPLALCFQDPGIVVVVLANAEHDVDTVAGELVGPPAPDEAPTQTLTRPGLPGRTSRQCPDPHVALDRELSVPDPRRSAVVGMWAVGLGVASADVGAPWLTHRTAVWSARRAGDERGDDVGGVAVQRLAATVIAHRRPWVGVARCCLHVAQRHAGVEAAVMKA